MELVEVTSVDWADITKRRKSKNSDGVYGKSLFSQAKAQERILKKKNSGDPQNLLLIFDSFLLVQMLEYHFPVDRVWTSVHLDLQIVLPDVLSQIIETQKVECDFVELEPA